MTDKSNVSTATRDVIETLLAAEAELNPGYRTSCDRCGARPGGYVKFLGGYVARVCQSCALEWTRFLHNDTYMRELAHKLCLTTDRLQCHMNAGDADAYTEEYPTFERLQEKMYELAQLWAKNQAPPKETADET